MNHEESPQTPLPKKGGNREEGDTELPRSEQIVGIGALCDFVDSAEVEDPTARFRVTEYCQLDSGRTVAIRDTGFNLSRTLYTGNKAPDPDPTAGLTVEFLTQEVLNLTGPEVRPDGSTSQEDHDWDELALCAQNAGVKVTKDQLKALGYSVKFTDRVRQHFPSE